MHGYTVIPQRTGWVTRIQSDSWRIKSDSQSSSFCGHPVDRPRLYISPKCQYRIAVFESHQRTPPGVRSLAYALHFPQAKGRKGVTMDFAIILIVSNTLLAAFIYFVVTRIWQD